MHNALGAAGPWFTPLMMAIVPLRLGVSAEKLRPGSLVQSLTIPKFFIFGTADRDTTLPESMAMLRAAAGPEQMWAVEGARHVDLPACAGGDFDGRVLEFLSRCRVRRTVGFSRVSQL